MNSANPWLESVQQFQQSTLQQWTQLLQSGQMPGPFATPTAGLGFVPPELVGAADLSKLLSQIAGQAVKIDPARLLEIQQAYLKEATELWNQGLQPSLPKDRRFAAPAWTSSPHAAHTAALYLLNARTLMSMAEAVDADAKTKARVAFAVQQWIDASA
ncbi:MAG: hypothetical protein RJA36_3326, partial [Pseudomonadota bacterium]